MAPPHISGVVRSVGQGGDNNPTLCAFTVLVRQNDNIISAKILPIVLFSFCLGANCNVTRARTADFHISLVPRDHMRIWEISGRWNLTACALGDTTTCVPGVRSPSVFKRLIYQLSMQVAGKV